MRIGILSDTHDKLERTRIAVDLMMAAGAESLFHCGDLTRPSILEACAVAPLYFTLGNNDADAVTELKAAGKELGAICVDWGGIIQLAEKRIGLFHGHLTTDRRRVMSFRPDYLLSGHSHIRADNREDSVRRINPGALHRADHFTVAILDLASDELQFLAVPR